MKNTKARFASFYDATANSPAVAGGKLTIQGDDGSGGVVSPDFVLKYSDIVSASFSSYAAGTDQRDDVTMASTTVGDKLIITVVYPDSRQLTRHSFTVYVATGDTLPSLALKFEASINTHGVFTAVAATNDVQITLGSGDPFTIVVSAGLTVASSAAHVEAVGTSADLTADGLSGYAPANTYDVFEIEHYVDVPSGTNKKTIELTKAISRVYTLVANIGTYDTTGGASPSGGTTLADILSANYVDLANPTAYAGTEVAGLQRLHDKGIGTVS